MPNFCKHHVSRLDYSLEESREQFNRLRHVMALLLNSISAEFEEEDRDFNGNPMPPENEIQEGAVDNAAGIGVYWGHGDQRNISGRLSGIQTRDRAEIHSAITAIRQARESGYRSAVINTRSMDLINSVTTWLPIWRANDWMLPSGEEVPNRDDFQELDDAMDGIEVRWVHVQGNPGIEEAGALANAGAAE